MPCSPFEEQLSCESCENGLNIVREKGLYEVDEGAYICGGCVAQEDISFYYLRFWGCNECGWAFYTEKAYSWCNEYKLKKLDNKIKIDDIEKYIKDEYGDEEEEEELEIDNAIVDIDEVFLDGADRIYSENQRQLNEAEEIYGGQPAED